MFAVRERERERVGEREEESKTDGQRERKREKEGVRERQRGPGNKFIHHHWRACFFRSKGQITRFERMSYPSDIVFLFQQKAWFICGSGRTRFFGVHSLTQEFLKLLVLGVAHGPLKLVFLIRL